MRRWWAPGGLVVAALLLRVAYVMVVPQSPVDLDAGEYDWLARTVLAGRGLVDGASHPYVSRAPLYPLVLATVYAVFGADPVSARLFQAVVGALVCAGSYLLARRLFGERAGIAAAAVTALSPALIIYSGLLLTETLAGALVLLLALLITVDRTRLASPWRWLGIGLAGGAAALLRPEMLGLPVALVAAAWVVHRPRLPILASWTVALAGGTLLVVLPWTARNYGATGALVPVATGAGVAVWLATHPADISENPGNRRSDYPEYLALIEGKGPVEVDRALLRDGLRNFFHYPLAYVVNAGRRFVRLWLGSHTYAVPALAESFTDGLRARHVGVVAAKTALIGWHLAVLAAAAAGFALAVARGGNRAPLLLLLSPVFYLGGVYVALFSTLRYHVPLLPLLSAGAGFGVTEVWRQRERPEKGRRHTDPPPPGSGGAVTKSRAR